MHFKEGGLQLNRTIIFNGINGLEAFDLIVDTVTKEPPGKTDYRQSMPFRSGSYNMAKAIGRSTFDDRTIVYTCQLIEKDTEQLDKILTAINNWLLSPVEAVLQDTATPEYHFVGECLSVVPASNENGYVELTITFKCYPYKIFNNSISELEWDSIVFPIDVIPVTDFVIATGDTIQIDNICSTPVEFTSKGDYNSCTVEVNGTTYALNKNGKAGFVLQPGLNNITIEAVSPSPSNLTIDYVRKEL